MAKFNTLVEVIRHKGDSRGNGITFILGDSNEKWLSYKMLYEKSAEMLYNLQLNGMAPGDELIIHIEDNEEFVCLFWACILGGIIPVPVTVGNNDEQRLKLLKIWKILRNPRIVTNESIAVISSTVADAPDIFEEMESKTITLKQAGKTAPWGKIYDAKPGDIAFIQFSSGSTGDPKGVILTHENLITNIYAALKSGKFTDKDVMLSWMSLTHDMGLIGFHLSPLVLGSNQYIMPTSLFIRRPTLWLKKTNEHRASVLSSPNFGYKYFLSFFSDSIAENWDLSCVRLILNGAEPISPQLCNQFLDRMEEYGLKREAMFTVYGLAEASVAAAFPQPERLFSVVYLDRQLLKVGEKIKEAEGEGENITSFVNVGYPVDDCYIRICDEDNTLLEDDTVGHIQIKGKNVTSGYYNNPGKTREIITEDGWLNTGDLGFMREGSLVVTGRAKDIIFVHGHNYYPHDIERLTEEIDGIELGKVAVCGVYNPETQKDDIVIFVLYKKTMDNFFPLWVKCRQHIRRKMGVEVKDVVPVRKIPKTTSGKVQRYKLGEDYTLGKFDNILEELRQLEAAGSGELQITHPMTDTEKRVALICKETMSGKDIDIHENFFEAGVDSILLAQMYEKLAIEFPGKISISKIYEYPNIAKLAKHLSNSGDTGADDMPIEDESEDINAVFGKLESGDISLDEAIDNLFDMGGKK